MSATEDLIRELRDAINANDFERAAQLMDSDVVHYGTRGGIDQDRVLRGHEEVLGYWNEVGEAWASVQYEAERIIESGDLVVVFWRETARSPRTDLEVETSTAAVVKVSGGKIVELRGYMDRDEALRAAGVTEE